jgi:hypothetical protein
LIDPGLVPYGSPNGSAVWVLADPRAGTAAQALGVGERLGVPFRTVELAWSRFARLPLPGPTLLGLRMDVRRSFRPPWPQLVISAGRRSAPVALWLGRRGARTVHCMHPGFGAARFDLLVLGRHDKPPEAPNILPLLGATHRLSPARLAAARAEWSGVFAEMPTPRVALLVGGPVRGRGMRPARRPGARAEWSGVFAEMPTPRVALLVGGPVRGRGMRPADAAALTARVAAFAGSVLATTSRRTGAAASEAVSQALAGIPHRLHRWGDRASNPYPGLLAWADMAVVTGDSVSMLSEALMMPVPLFIADPGNLGRRHRALAAGLIAGGQARPLEDAPLALHREPVDETARVVATIRARGLLDEA